MVPPFSILVSNALSSLAMVLDMVVNVLVRASKLIGFVRNSHIPASKQLSRSSVVALAVKATIGVFLSTLRMLFVASTPSISRKAEAVGGKRRASS